MPGADLSNDRLNQKNSTSGNKGGQQKIRLATCCTLSGEGGAVGGGGEGRGGGGGGGGGFLHIALKKQSVEKSKQIPHQLTRGKPDRKRNRVSRPQPSLPPHKLPPMYWDQEKGAIEGHPQGE